MFPAPFLPYVFYNHTHEHTTDSMKLFSLTQTLFGYQHEREHDRWVRKRNGKTLHPEDQYHPQTYGTKARFVNLRPRHIHYEPDDLYIEELYAHQGQRERPPSPEPVVLRRERREHGWHDTKDPSYERAFCRPPSPVVEYREPRHVARNTWDEPLYDRPIARPPSPRVVYQKPRHVAKKSWEQAEFYQRPRSQPLAWHPSQPGEVSFREHSSIGERTFQRPTNYQESDRYNDRPRPGRHGRARSPPPSPFSTASTLLESVYEPEHSYGRENRHHGHAASPRPADHRVRFASPTRTSSIRRTESVNPLIRTIHANANHRDSRDARSRLESLAFMVYPIMHKFHLKVDCLSELDESFTGVESWNSGQGREISIKLRGGFGTWRSMDEMVDSMMGELAHNVYRERGREWYALRERLRKEVGRSGR